MAFEYIAQKETGRVFAGCAVFYLTLFVLSFSSKSVFLSSSWLSAVHPEGRKGVLRLYQAATAPKYGFLYVDVTAPPERMFHANFRGLGL